MTDARYVRVSPHFVWGEFWCRDGTPVPSWGIAAIRELCHNLEVLRYVLGGRPIRVISGYRTPEWNRHVGGAPKSQHLACRAVDIQVEGVPAEQVYETILRLIEAGAMLDGGVGLYADRPEERQFVHYDIRSIAGLKPARWVMRESEGGGEDAG